MEVSPIIFRVVNGELTASTVGPAKLRREPSAVAEYENTGDKSIESWRIKYEKVREADDARGIRPLLCYQIISNESMKIKRINYWFILFDFAEGRIAG